MSAYLSIIKQVTEKPKVFIFGSCYDANIARQCIDSAATMRKINVHISQKRAKLILWRGEMEKIDLTGMEL